MSTLVTAVLPWQGQHTMCYQRSPGAGSVCISWGSCDRLVSGKRWLFTILGFSQFPCKPLDGANSSLPYRWCAGGVILNIKWLDGVFYAALNVCTAKAMRHSQALQLLNELFLSEHFKDCGKDGASCPKFQLQDFLSKGYAENLSQKRWGLTAGQSHFPHMLPWQTLCFSFHVIFENLEREYILVKKKSNL